ncbi:MAG: PEGA domain-containing protein [Candidatus Zixiibacteriota bacterium]|nr:MAG: PEGA domain-containing protein [candidate division Zixibacteria bacterium]
MLFRGNVALAALLLLPLLAAGQTSTGGFSINSSPSGAEVMVKGALTVTGITPVSFMQGLEGVFKVQVRKHGYETYKSSVFLQSGRPMSLNVRLSPKTRMKAAARSLFVPGWGQAYSGRKFKGRIFTLLAVGSMAAYLIADNDLDDKEDRHNEIREQYLLADTYEQKQRLYPLLREAREDAYDSENIRRITIGITVAVWSLNLLDALFFFPEKRDSYIVDQLSVQADFEQGGVRLVAACNF